MATGTRHPIFALHAHQTHATSERKGTARRSWLRKLKDKYRLLLINDRTFEERFSIRLNRLNVILLGLGAFTLYGAFVTAVIVFTPLKRYIPGYSDQETKRNAYRSLIMADSLELELGRRDLYIDNLRMVLSGELPVDSAHLLAPLLEKPSAADLEPGMADSLLRARVAREEAYSLNEGRGYRRPSGTGRHLLLSALAGYRHQQVRPS